MTTIEKARRVLSALGRPAGHADGLYKGYEAELAAHCDNKGNVTGAARSTWLRVHNEVMAGAKGTDEATDELDDEVDGGEE